MADQTATCPHCGNAVSPKLLGLCPDCMLKAALNGGPEKQTGQSAGAEGSRRRRFVPPDVEELSAGFPQLEILALLGHGGMGAVYKARQKHLGRLVALKILPPEVGEEPAFAERFAREARALAQLSHPNIVTLYEFGQSQGPARLYYFLMEYVEGLNLRQLLDGRKLPPKEALAIVPQICDALQFAHDRGIVHRDIKPENILISKDGVVKIADFGVAKIVASSDGMAPQQGETGEISPEAAGMPVVGTPPYMAPEQVERPAEVDHRADIYSLGVVFYQMLTGELPQKQLQPPSARVQIDVRLDEVVLRAMKREPELRYQQVSQVKTQIQTIAAAPAALAGAVASQGGDAPQPLGAKDLERLRVLTAIRAVVLCIAAAIFGISMPEQYGIPALAWGVLSCILVLQQAFGFRRTPSQDEAAVRRGYLLGLVQAMGVLSAGLLLALNNQGLTRAWNLFLAGVMAAGIGVDGVRLVHAVWKAYPGVRARRPLALGSILLSIGALTGPGLITLYNQQTEPRLPLRNPGPTTAASASGLGRWLAEAGVDPAVLDAPDSRWLQVNLVQSHFGWMDNFRCVVRHPNLKDYPVKVVQFVNSDIATVDVVVDRQGRQAQMASESDSGTDHYTALLSEPTPPGQDMVYGMAGRCRGAWHSDPQTGDFAYEMQHWPATGRPTRRIEVHRLPPGAQVVSVSENATWRMRDSAPEVVLDTVIPAGGSVKLRFVCRMAGATSGTTTDPTTKETSR